MTAQIYRVCASSLLFALRLPTATDLPAATELRQRAMSTLDDMVAQGRAEGLPDAELAEARYALVAFVDEQILKSSWPGRTEWMSQPLQLLLYREYTAGENFFVRLRSLLQSGARPLALEAYYLCLALGFRGAYGVSGETAAIATYVETARRELAKRLPATSKFGPNVQTKDQLQAENQSNALLYGVVAGCALLVLLVLLGLHFALSSELNATLSGFAAAPATKP